MDGSEDTFAVKPKKRGITRSTLREEDHPDRDRKNIHISIDDVVISERHNRTNDTQVIWNDHETKPSLQGISLSTTQLFIDSLATDKRAEINDETNQTLVDDTKELVKEQPSIFEDRFKSIAEHVKELKDQGSLRKDYDSTESKFSFDITHRDSEGNILTPKEAYKELSRKFHGTGLGKKRIEKKLRQKGAAVMKPKSRH